MKSSRVFVFLKSAQLPDVKTLWRASMACLLFFSLLGAEAAQAQIFQFMPGDQNYAAALAVAFAQESSAGVDGAAKVNLDEDFAPADFGLETVGMLPTSPFYFLKSARRGITSFFTFDPTKKAELSLQYASEKFLEAKTLAGQEGVDPADVTSALDSFGKELDKATGRIDRVGTSGTDTAKDALSDKVMDSVLKYAKSLDSLEKDLPPEAFQKAEETKDKAFATFGSVGGLIEPDKVAEKLVTVLDDQKGSEFKNFKNVEVLKEVKENVPPAMEEALKVAEDNTLLKLQNELEGLENSQKALLKDFVQNVSGNELRHLEIINDLEVRPVSADLREAISNAKEETLTRTEARLEKLTPDERNAYVQHLESGNLEDVRVVKDLENNIKPEVFQNVEAIKKSVTESYAKKFENTNEAEKAKILEKVGQFHDAKSLAIFDEIDALIPADKKGVFDEIKKRAAEEIRKDFERARNTEQRKVILDSLAGDHPDELEAIQWFRSGVDKSYKNVFDNLSQTQFKAIEDHAGQISDKDKLAKFESDVKKSEGASNVTAFDWKSIFGSLDEKKKVFEIPSIALEKVRSAEVVVSDFRDVVSTLPLNVAFNDGKFDYTAQEIGRLLDLAERRVEMARTVLGYNDVGRAFSEAEQGEKIARDGLRMAQEYKAGKKRITPPPAFFLPTSPDGQKVTQAGGTPGGMQLYNEYEFGQYCFFVGGFMKTRMYCALDDGRVFDARGKTFPIDVSVDFIPRIESTMAVPSTGEKCAVMFTPPPNFCPKGKIVYGMDERDCNLPPRCEPMQNSDSSRVNPTDPLMCGGIAGFECPSGYSCQLPNTNVSDAFGKCTMETNTCQASFTGFMYDNTTQKCRAESTSACRDPFIYHDVASCESAQGKVIKPIAVCPGMPTVNACPAGQKKVITYNTPECGVYYGCEPENQSGIYPYTFSNGYVVKDYAMAKEYCMKYPPASGGGIAGECETRLSITYTTNYPMPDSSKWVKHVWKFSDGMTSDSMIMNRTDADYNSFISSIEAQCSKIPMNKFTWRPSASNDSMDNWKNFGIPDCSGTGITAVMCGNGMCEMGETVQSCSQDCGSTGGSTASTMKRCFYPNATQNGTMFGYSVWCEADYYNCHRETPTGAEIKTEGLSLGAPSSCESGTTSTGGYVDCTASKTQSLCAGPQCYWSSMSASCIATSGTASTGGGDPSLAMPTGLGATKVSGGVKLEWNSSAQNAMKVKIYRKTNGGTWAFRDEYSITSGTSGMMSYMDTTATSGSYEYYVQVCHATGCSNSSNTASITVTSTAGTTQCSDNKDNDGDGWIDMGDSGCTGPDDDNETYVAPTVTPTPSPTTSGTCTGNAASCTTSSTCAGAGYYWCTPSGYPAGCSYAPCPSSTSTSCPSGQYWYVPPGGSSTSGYCMSSSGGSGSCSSMPGYCTTEASCTSYNFYWCNGGCVSNSSMCSSTVSSCSSSTVPGNCTSSTACAGAGYYWCGMNNTCITSSSGCTSSYSGGGTMTCNGNGTCESNESASSCPSDCGSTGGGYYSGGSGTCTNTPAYCYSQSECTSHAFYWCNNACYQTNASCPTP